MVMGQRGGRFDAELHGRHGQPALARVNAAVDDIAKSWVDEEGLVGVAVVQGWRMVRTKANNMDAWNLISANSRLLTRHSGQRYFEHDVVASAVFNERAPLPTGAWSTLGVAALGQQLFGTMADFSVTVTRDGGSDVRGRLLLRELVAAWTLHWPTLGSVRLAWPTCCPLAAALVSSRWRTDVTVHARRSNGPTAAANLCHGLPTGRLQGFLREEIPADLEPTDDHDVEDRQVMERHRWPWPTYGVGHLINAVRLGRRANNMDGVAEAAIDALHFALGPRVHAEVDRLANFVDEPSRYTLSKARVRFDVANMLQCRWWYRLNRPTFRYITYDASPQRGSEVFASAERIFTRADLRANAHPQVNIRRLPMVYLGVGRTGAADKLQALMHQTWLEYGPGVDSVRAANADVRQCLSDMGAEAIIADSADVVDLMSLTSGPTREPAGGALVPFELGQLVPHQGQQAPLGFSQTFPLALKVVGPQHLLDVSLQHGLASLPWWSTWAHQAKVVCQWLHPKMRREHLANLPALTASADLKRSLDAGVSAFAKWRWQTLSEVTRDLLRIRDAVRCAVNSLNGVNELASRDSTLANQFMANVQGDSFWDRADLLQAVARPVANMAGWLKGCDCHEEALVNRQKVDCVWKGCRAPHLSRRLGQLYADLERVRGDASRFGAEAVNCGLVSSRLLSTLRVKFNWVDELPYLVWQIRDRQMGQRFLAKRDVEAANRRQLHPVTELFAGQHAESLRVDLQAYVEGSPISVDLHVQLRSYELCMLDDTWSESSHRDVSNFVRTARAASRPTWSAALRIKQNLSAYKACVGRQRRMFFDHFHQWKSIGQRDVGRANMLIPVRQRRSAVVSWVYRLGQHAHRDWASVFALRGPLTKTEDRLVLPVHARVQVEYLQHVLVDGGVFSIPRSTDAQVDAARAGRLADADAILHGNGTTLTFVQVLDKNVGRKKQVNTAASANLRGMCVPVSVQSLMIWPTIDGTCVLLRNGPIEVVDFLTLSSWPTLQGGLRRWEVASDEADRLTVANPVSMTAIEWDFGQRVPLAITLERLFAEGWQQWSTGMDCPDSHTPGGPLVFRTSRLISSWAYLQCLCRLADLHAKDNFSLPVGEYGVYYECILGADNPHGVRLAQPLAYYREILTANTPALDVADIAQLEDDVAANADDSDDNERQGPPQPELGQLAAPPRQGTVCPRAWSWVH